MAGRAPRSTLGSAPPPRRPAPPPPSHRGGWLRWGAVAALVVGALVYATWEVLPVLGASLALAYVLDRPMQALTARGLSRESAFTLLVGVFGLALVLVIAVVVPSIASQVGTLAVQLKPALAGLHDRVEPWVAQIQQRTGVQVPLDLEAAAEIAPEYLQHIADAPDAREAAQEWLGGLFGGGLAVVGSLLELALLPFFTFYLALDWPRLVVAADDMVPPRHRPLVRQLARDIHYRIGGFIEGQLTLCVILGVLYSIGLWAVGVDLAFTLGLISGALFIVPYAGAVIGVGLSMLLALLKFGVDWHVLACAAVFFVVHLIEGSFLTPRIVGKRVGLHPLVVMVAVVAGGHLLGLWGVLLAVPFTAAGSVIVAELARSYTQSRFFRG